MAMNQMLAAMLARNPVPPRPVMAPGFAGPQAGAVLPTQLLARQRPVAIPRPTMGIR